MWKAKLKVTKTTELCATLVKKLVAPKCSCLSKFQSHQNIDFSNAFLLRYGKGFGIAGNIPNGLLGIGFYVFMMLLTLFNSRFTHKLQLVLSGVSNLMSVYLAYLLYFVLQDFCVVCISTYFVNYVILLILLKQQSRKSRVE